MRRCLVGLCLSAWLLAGCRAPAPHPFPPDPLLLSKQPTDKLLAPPAPTLVAVTNDPQPPPFPRTTLVADAEVPGTLAARSQRQPLVLTPAVRTRESLLPPTHCYDQAPDRSWLQGVLEKHYEGTWELRFAPPSVHDPNAGKVRLENDPRLAAYGDGAAVRVEGAVVPPVDLFAGLDQERPPLYRLRSVRPLAPHLAVRP